MLSDNSGEKKGLEHVKLNFLFRLPVEIRNLFLSSRGNETITFEIENKAETDNLTFQHRLIGRKR